MPSPSVYDCAEAFARLDDYLDRELSAEEMERAREHLSVCATCAEEFRFEARLLELLRARLVGLRAPEELRQRVERAVARARHENSSPPRA